MPSYTTQQLTGSNKSQQPSLNQPTQPQQGVSITRMPNQPVNNQTSASSSTSAPNPDAQHPQQGIPDLDA